MATLNGTRVRLRMAELNWDWEQLSARSLIPERTLQNTTRDRNPDSIRLIRVGQLLEALNPPHIKRRGLEALRLEDILASTGGDGTPDPPPEQPKNPTKPKRRDKDPQGPPRTDRAESRLAS